MVGGVAVPWSLFNLQLARHAPERALNPLIVAGDMLMLASIELAAPETYGAVRFIALSLLAVHAHFRASASAWPWPACRSCPVTPTALRDWSLGGDLLVFYEAVFAASAVCHRGTCGTLPYHRVGFAAAGGGAHAAHDQGRAGDPPARRLTRSTTARSRS